MTDEERIEDAIAQRHVGEGEEGQLEQQTPGLDEGVTSAIAGPDWDPELVREARESVPGQELTGQVEDDESGT